MFDLTALPQEKGGEPKVPLESPLWRPQIAFPADRSPTSKKSGFAPKSFSSRLAGGSENAV
jgi:hypothetical protein